MLSHFIRRSGKRKAPKGKASDLTSIPNPSSDVLSPRVFNIGDPTLDLDEAGSSTSIIDPSPLVHLDLPSASEEWFPQELLQGRANSPVSLADSRGTATPISDNLILVIGQHSQSTSSSEQTPPAEDVRSGHHARKKSVPAPIIIPDVDRLFPSAETHSAPLSSVLLTKSAPQNDETASNLPPSPSSGDLSAVSGTTLARALMANSFVLSSAEHRKSRRRSGMTRQDSATLPRGSISDRRGTAQPTSSSESAGPPAIPPVPPLPMGPFLHPKYAPGLSSGSSTSSGYPISDAYALSPVMNHAGRRISRVQEVATPSTPALSATAPPQSMRFASPQTHRSSTSDVPNTASDQLSLDSWQGVSSQAESFILSSDHTLDEFDFVPLGPQSMVSPGSESSASYMAPRRDISRRQRKRRGGGLNIMTSTPKDDIATDATLVSPRGNAITSAVSDLGYGELLNYPVTVNPDVTPSWSTTSVSAGYQTFPETPALFTPLASGALGGFTPNNQSSKSASGKLSHHGTLVNRHMAGKNDVLQRSRTATALLSIQKAPLPPMPERPSTSPSPHVSQTEAIAEPPQEPGLTEEAEEAGGVEEIEEIVETNLRPHPLAHISTSSSNLEAEEALQAFARHSCSSLPSVIMYPDQASSSPPEYPHLIPLPDSRTVSPASPLLTESIASAPPSMSTLSESISQHQPKAPHQQQSSLGSSFLPSPSSLSPSPFPSPREYRSRTTSPAPHMPPSRASSDHSVSPSYVAPPPYHIVVSEQTQPHPLSAGPESQPSLSRPPSSRRPSTDTVYERIREASTSTAPDARSRTRARSRPRLPGGPRKPSVVTQQPLGSLVPGVTNRNGSVPSVTTPEGGSSLNSSPWPKLYAAASNPPPKFHTPAPKWRGLTMEAAQWTFTSDELQGIVSRAIQGSFEGSSIRLLRLETLDGEIADETHRLEMQRTDIKAQYKALVRKRWTLMGALAGHVEGVEMNDTATAIQTMEELAEVSLALDHLAEKLHDIIEQLAQLKSLREVHNGSALAMALRKMHRSFFRQMAEREQLVGQICDLQTERDEAWKHAEKVAKDWDELNDRLTETTGGGEVQSPVNDDAISFQSNRCSARLSALRKSSVRRSQAGLRSRKPRSRHSSFSGVTTNGVPSAPSAGDVPPVPRVPPLPLNSRASTMMTAALSSGGPLSTSASFYSSSSVRDSTDVWALAQAQRDVYEMLGISIPSSVASPRPRTISGPLNLQHGSRPVSESATGGLKSRAKGRRATTEEGNRAIKSDILDDDPSPILAVPFSPFTSRSPP